MKPLARKELGLCLATSITFSYSGITLKKYLLKNPKTIFLFFLILFTSLLFRITNLSVIEFKGDEALTLFLTTRTLFGHPFPPIATISSVGILNFPLLLYFVFPFSLISLNPIFISGGIALLNSLANGFLFIFLKKYYGFTTAFIATILIALSPWAILYSRKIWAQDFIFPIAIILLFSIHKLIIEKKKYYWVLYASSTLFLVQLHQPLFYFLTILSIFMLFKAKIHIPSMLIGFILGIIPTIPYVFYEIGHGFPDYFAFLAYTKLSFPYSLLTFARPFQILSQGDFHFIIGDDMSLFAKMYPLSYWSRLFFYTEYLLLPFGLIIFWKTYPKLRFLTYSCILLPIIYFFSRTPTFMHYFIILIPFLFIFLATGITFLLNQKNIILKYMTYIILCLLIISSITYNTGFFYMLNFKKSLKGDYGVSYAQMRLEKIQPLEKYKSSNGYQEMILVSYIGLDSLGGNQRISSVIYDYTETKNNLIALERKLNKTPEDPRIKQELIAYYLHKPLTKATLSRVNEKVIINPIGYGAMYDLLEEKFREENKKDH